VAGRIRGLPAPGYYMPPLRGSDEPTFAFN